MWFVLLIFSYKLYVKSNVQMCASFGTSWYCFPYMYVKTTMYIHVILFVTVMWMWVYQLFPKNTSSYNDPKMKHTLFLNDVLLFKSVSFPLFVYVFVLFVCCCLLLFLLLLLLLLLLLSHTFYSVLLTSYTATKQIHIYVTIKVNAVERVMMYIFPIMP